MLRFGMPSLIELDTVEDNVYLCKELGLDFIELNMNVPIFTPEKIRSKELKELKSQYQIDFTIHLPEELDLTSFQPQLRRGHLERCKEVIEWASVADIKTINMHLNTGIYFTLPEENCWINEKYESEFLTLLKESYKELLGFATLHNVKLCTENTRNFHLPFIFKGLEELSEFHNFYLTWDVGHDAKGEYKETPVFNTFLNRVKHMHIHDYNGKKDHQVIYSGNIPINSHLYFAATQSLTVVIEVKTANALRESVKLIRRNFIEEGKV